MFVQGVPACDSGPTTEQAYWANLADTAILRSVGVNSMS
jgi:hypothetical protein